MNQRGQHPEDERSVTVSQHHGLREAFRGQALHGTLGVKRIPEGTHLDPVELAGGGSDLANPNRVTGALLHRLFQLACRSNLTERTELYEQSVPGSRRRLGARRTIR